MKSSLLSLFLFFSFIIGFNEAFADWNPKNSEITSNSNASNLEYLAPNLGFNQSGYTVAVWGFLDNSTSRSYQQAAISTDFGVTWSPAVSIDADNYQQNFRNTRPRVIVNDKNQALMIWQRRPSTSNFEVKVCNLLNTDVGPSAQNLYPLDLNAGSAAPRPDITYAGNNVIAVWGGRSGANFDVYFSTSSDFGENWTLKATIPMGTMLTSQMSPLPKIYLDETGLAVVVWQYTTDFSTYYVCQSVSTDFGNSWSNAAIISGPAQDWTVPVVGGDGNGNAVVAWQERTGPWPTHYDLRTSSYSTGSGWGFTQTIDSIYDYCYPSIAVNNNNQAIIAYQKTDDTDLYWTTKTVYSSNGGQSWNAPIFVDPLNFYNDYTRPEVAMNNDGVVLTGWNCYLDTGDWAIKGAVSTDYGSNWSVNILNPLVKVGSTHQPKVKVFILNSDNQNVVNGMAIWPQVDIPGTYGAVEMNHFQKTTLRATGTQKQLNGFSQIDLINRITTLAIGEIGTYKLYKDIDLTQLVDSVTTDGRTAELIDHHVRKGESYIYYLTWTDEFGSRTGPIKVTIER